MDCLTSNRMESRNNKYMQNCCKKLNCSYVHIVSVLSTNIRNDSGCDMFLVGKKSFYDLSLCKIKQYTVQLHTVDESGRTGEAGEQDYLIIEDKR